MTPPSLTWQRAKTDDRKRKEKKKRGHQNTPPTLAKSWYPSGSPKVNPKWTKPERGCKVVGSGASFVSLQAAEPGLFIPLNEAQGLILSVSFIISFKKKLFYLDVIRVPKCSHFLRDSYWDLLMQFLHNSLVQLCSSLQQKSCPEQGCQSIFQQRCFNSS